MGLQDIVNEFQDVTSAVTGIKSAPDYAPDQLNAFPFAVAYLKSGTISYGPIGVMTGLHQVVIELHVARGNLADAIRVAMPYGDSVPNALLLALKNNTYTSFKALGAIEYTFGPLGWGGVDTFGYRFTISNIKTQSNVA